jgi:C-terminal processing protease CtpA/Prc
VQVNGQYIPGYNRARMLNANSKARESLIGEMTSTDHGLMYGKTSDGIGYISINRLTDTTLADDFDEVLEKMADTKGLIIDLRYNGGGSEPLGQQITGRFLDRPRVYSLSQFRSGPKHTDLTEKKERTCEPGGPWSYVGPVAVLQGQKTMSSAESFALMLAQCPQVTTIGDRTAGSSGNPRQIQAGAGIVANLPRWIDLDPDGKPIDFVGISPRIKIDAKPEDFSGERDPVLSAALENLRTRAKADQGKTEVLLKRAETSTAAH